MFHMSDDSSRRNFRVTYYDKVGCRSAISEKALVAILKDEVIEQKKLESFCIRFPVPASYRMLIWKILLNILPIHQQSHKFVMQQRKDQFDDLQRALVVMRKINDQTSPSETCLRMYLLETGELGLQFFSAPWHKFFCSIASAVNDMADCSVTAYWLSVYMYKFFNNVNYLKYNHEFIDVIVTTLKKENIKLFHHIETLHLIDNLPIVSWYKHAFAEVLHSDPLEKIWDVLLGQAPRILPYVAVQILLTHEIKLFQLDSLAKCLSLLNSVPYSHDLSDIIVSKSTDLWLRMEKIP